jgi:hypothetical protein
MVPVEVELTIIPINFPPPTLIWLVADIAE